MSLPAKTLEEMESEQTEYLPPREVMGSCHNPGCYPYRPPPCIHLEVSLRLAL
jgi:hypothetical protein